MRVERTSGILRIELVSESETDLLGEAIAQVIKPGVVVGLVGPLGAGKTRLSRAIAEGLGVAPGAIASPTFILIHEYEGRLPVYHVDTYRLDDPDEFEALGIIDEFGGPGVCLIEWADRVRDLLPTDSWWVDLEPTGPETRQVTLRCPPRATDQIADRLDP